MFAFVFRSNTQQKLKIFRCAANKQTNKQTNARTQLHTNNNSNNHTQHKAHIIRKYTAKLLSAIPRINLFLLHIIVINIITIIDL
jgi:hypothetical protein